MVLHSATLKPRKGTKQCSMRVFSVSPISKVVISSGDCIEMLIIIIILLVKRDIGVWIRYNFFKWGLKATTNIDVNLHAPA